MKVVIQCAARKDPAAGTFRTADGRPVVFLAHPEWAATTAGQILARPDDVSDDGRTWRERLVAYNNENGGDPLGLLPAWRLYTHDTYGRLVDRFGEGRVFILSAGWGLIPATYLTPDYDITFTGSADDWKRRRKGDVYDDLCLMPDDGEDTVFLGGKEYQPLFCKLMRGMSGSKTVFFRSADVPDLPDGFRPVRYATNTRTNWQYECARDLVAGRVRIGSA
jgi:hypothetical protein